MHDFKIISIIDNFLDKNSCNDLIKYFKKNIKDIEKYRDTYILKYIYQPILKKLNKNIGMFDFKKPDNMEIVKWPQGSFMDPHTDKGDFLSFIVYLNDNFKGGETIINGITVKPKKGSIVIFSNGHYLHHVNKVMDKERYTLIAWYK